MPIIVQTYGTPQQLAWNIGVAGSTAVPRRQAPVVGLVRHQRVDHRGAMRVDDALRPAGGAGRVAHRNRVIFLVRRVLEIRRCGGEESLVVHERCCDRGAGERHHDHLLERHLGPELLEERQQNVVDDEEAVARVVRDPRDLAGREAEIQRVHHAARRGDPEVALEVRVVIPTKRRDAVALLQTGRKQRRGESAGAPVEVGEAVPDERLVGQAADDLGIGVEAAGPLEQVVERQRHALHRRADHGRSPQCTPCRALAASLAQDRTHGHGAGAYARRCRAIISGTDRERTRTC